MKVFTASLLFTLILHTQQQVTQSPAWEAAFKQNQTDCAKENGVELSEAEKIWTDPTYPANNEALKCYYKCMTMRLSMIDDGKYDPIDAAKVLARHDTQGELKEIQDECSNLPPNADDCEFAYQLNKCISEAQLDR